MQPGPRIVTTTIRTYSREHGMLHFPKGSRITVETVGPNFCRVSSPKHFSVLVPVEKLEGNTEEAA